MSNPKTPDGKGGWLYGKRLLGELMAKGSLENEAKALTQTIVGYYEPTSTRWRRNYNDRAEWYFIWNYGK